MSPTDSTAVSPIQPILEERISSGTLDLPLLPKVAGLVISLTNDESTDASALSKLIRSDPALAAHVMRVANSPVFRARTPPATLQQAIARMGMNVICEISVAISLGGKVFAVPGQEARVADLWRRALATGSWGKEIARVRRRNVESAFLCGLLHDVGKPILVGQIGEIADELGVTVDDDAFDALVDDHAVRVGSTVAELWQLPAPVIDAIAHHRDYTHAPSFADEAMTTAAAATFANWMIDGTDEESLRAEPVMQDLNLYPEDVDVLVGRGDEVRGLVEAMVL